MIPALVLTAGLATRLRPLSNIRAKGALPVAGEALVCRILRWLKQAGVTRVVLNLHHRPETITREVGDGAALGLSVRYSWESPLLGSAGGPARAIPLLESDRFFIVNGDTLADVDLHALAEQHVATKALVTMAVVDGDPRYNGVIAEDDRVVDFGRTLALPHFALTHFVGVQAVNSAAFAGVRADVPSETVKALYPALIAKTPGSVRVLKTRAEFFDIGTPQDYLKTAIDIARREGKPLDRGKGTTVAPDARLDRTILWDNVTVGPGASLSNCIVTDGVTVPAGATYKDAVLT